MIEATSIRAILFARNLSGIAKFYSEALGMKCGEQDQHHAVLQRSGFELIVQQIPNRIAPELDMSQAPVRREGGAVRLDYPVESIEKSRSLARSLGGDIDEAPPPWADRSTNFYLGFDPEGNVFGVSQRPDP